MALKKSQLYSSLWSSCDELRGGMDASQYKDYVLTLLFMKYVSDKYGGKSDALIEVPKGGSFADMVNLKNNKEIGDKINKIIGRLAEANDLKGVIDVADFNDEDKIGKGKEMQDRLSQLVAIFEELDFHGNRAEGDDLLGDAYEYLMRHFATESGKSKGQFYTPAEVSRVMAKILGIGPKTTNQNTIYDPTCGSGSLLLKAADEAPKGITIFGQENDLATWALARMNMILHGHPTAELWKGNTLSAPHFKKKDGSLETFDFAVANPPFSAKSWSNGLNPEQDEFSRFEYGVPPAKNGDYAFLLQIVKSLKSTGKGAVILPHGVLFRGNKEADIRRNLLSRGFIKGIIGLPPNLFYGTGIPACIVVIDKQDAHARKGVFMIDASKDFMKDGNKNRLRAQDIHKIVDVFNRQKDIPGYSRMVPLSEITNPKNEYNLNIPRYIDSSEPEDIHDLDAHLRGGIPNADLDGLAPFWKVLPSLRRELFRPADRPGYSRPIVESRQVKEKILAHPEFKGYSADVVKVFDGWVKANRRLFEKLDTSSSPKELIRTISENLLHRFDEVPLLDKYDVYQRLMEYWQEVMQDDVYLVVAEGWVGASKPRTPRSNGDPKKSETPDLVLGSGKGAKKFKMDLVPPPLIAQRFFPRENASLALLQAAQERASFELEQFVEEHTGDEGLLIECVNEKGGVTKVLLKDRLNALKDEAETKDECAAIKKCLELLETKIESARALDAAQAELDWHVVEKYARLTEEDVKAVVVDDRWLHSLRSTLDNELESVISGLVDRVRQLEERYAAPLPTFEKDVQVFGQKVEAHLGRMGLVLE